ncbi:MAG: AmmeMemoRadiSam system protein B [Syntrophales bacterium]|jgi:AmmeMemoRadiSam system protein B/AmmeMemoRadiSam system protein A|nr:AmmeMemoRadiSam system protein B [Syntrophales bacterium]MCK9528822.1 AmmeMemoRadiSam system protein B [Syntrophales bacterium]MDX9921978.1 AmmeMemoRadiSam system protein B [Syntrophales bacterium]
MDDHIRKALLAGSWYPASSRELQRRIEEYAGSVSMPALSEKDDLLAVITPHAGLSYSGRVAAAAWTFAARAAPDAIILIGISHRQPFRGATVYGGAGYESPLGVLPVDRELAGLLLDRGDVDLISRGFDERNPENSIELQVPFIQILLPGLSFVPVTVGSQDPRVCDAVASAIIASVKRENRKVLVAASSDFSHFHRYDGAVKMDLATLDFIKKMDAPGLHDAIERGASEACGYGPIRIAMTVAEAWGCNSVQVLQYENSGDVTGDRSGVVGYAAVALMKSAEQELKNRELSEDEENELINIARESIGHALAGRKFSANQAMGERLREPRGAFVTLKQRGTLRGCIGYIHPVKPLCKTVADAARAAAFDDPRFASLTPEEFENMDIEISVLEPLRKISTIDEIEPGRHGLYITRGSRSGLLLPQVARDHRWDTITFLEETCIKAGLPPDSWRDSDTEIYLFCARVIGKGR